MEQAKERAEETKKGTLQFWGCEETHLLRDFPHRKHDSKRVYNVHGASTINDVAKSIPRIYATVENQQANHQASMVELKGIITGQPIFILIDPVSNLSYILPRVVEACSLQRNKHTKVWLVQLSTITNGKVAKVVESCPIRIVGFQTHMNMNAIPLGSYDILLGID
jgi:hypothetical protein